MEPEHSHKESKLVTRNAAAKYYIFGGDWHLGSFHGLLPGERRFSIGRMINHRHRTPMVPCDMSLIQLIPPVKVLIFNVVFSIGYTFHIAFMHFEHEALPEHLYQYFEQFVDLLFSPFCQSSFSLQLVTKMEVWARENRTGQLWYLKKPE